MAKKIESDEFINKQLANEIINFIDNQVPDNLMNFYITKIQLLINKLKDFLSKDEIMNLIQNELRMKFDYSYKNTNFYKKKVINSLKVSDKPK